MAERLTIFFCHHMRQVVRGEGGWLHVKDGNALGRCEAAPPVLAADVDLPPSKEWRNYTPRRVRVSRG